jgi:Domain of unknown function (DUF4388)
MDFPEILQWISVGRKTGTLHLERRSVQKRIVFRDGVIFTSWSNDPRESLGQFLIRDRQITEEQLFKALIRQENQGPLLGAILMEQGILTEDALRAALRNKAEETIYDLFLWNEGRFEFKDGEFPRDIKVHLDLEVTAVVLEGIRRVDEWQRIRKVFPTMAVSFKLQGAPNDVEDPTERQALGLAAAGKTLAEMSLEMRRSDFETAELLFDLHQRGTLAIDRIGEDGRGPDPVGAIKDLLSLASQRLKERRYDGALQAYEDVLSLDRLNQNAKKGLIAVIEARNRERLLKTVPVDRIPVLTMDLVALTRENFDPLEGFVISRVNGQWDVQSILKLCPIAEEDALLIFARLLERKVIDLRAP